MRRKFLVMMLVSLSVVMVSVVAVLAFKQQGATIRSFSEQQNTLVEFAVDNFELALSGDNIDRSQNSEPTAELLHFRRRDCFRCRDDSPDSEARRI